MTTSKRKIDQLLELCSLRRYRLGKAIAEAKEEIRIAKSNFEYAKDEWIDVYAYQLKAAELKYGQLLKQLKTTEERFSPT